MPNHASYCDRVIHIDWKTPGGEFLGRLVTEYPDLAFLRTAEFSELVDDLANESPDECFEQVAPFFAAHNYQMWNLDSGGDDYNLFLVAADAQDDARREWGDAAAPTVATSAEPMQKKGKPAKKSKLPLIVEDSDYHLNYGGLLYGQALVQSAKWEQDDGSCEGLLDLRTFPLGLIPDRGFLEIEQSNESVWPMHGHGDLQYWCIRAKAKRKEKPVERLVVFSDYETGAHDDVPGLPMLSGAFPESFGSTMFFLHQGVSIAGVRRDHHVPLEIKRPADHEQPSWYSDDDPEPEPEQCALSVVRNGQHELVATITGYGSLVAMSESKVALVFGDNHIDAPNCRAVLLIDVDSKSVTASTRLPTNGENFFRINHDEIGYVHGVLEQHPDHRDAQQRDPYMIRFDARTGEARQSHIDGMCDNYKFKTRKYTKYPEFEEVKLNFHTFDGGISVSPGHDQWIVLNYATTAYGKHDLAWLWNTADDEVVRIQMSDFPQAEPRIHYVPSLSRYIGNDSCRVDLLIPFDDIYATRPRTKLVWEPLTR